MGARDIMPVSSPQGNHNRVVRMQIGTVSGLLAGEPVRVNTAGKIVEGVNNPVLGSGILGIAMGPYAASTKNPETGLTWANDDYVAVTLVDHDTWLIGRFTTDDSALATPTIANVGDEVGMALGTIGGVANRWCFSTNAGNKLGRIMDVLDAKRRSILYGGGTGVYVVVQVISSQLTNATAATAPAA